MGFELREILDFNVTLLVFLPRLQVEPSPLLPEPLWQGARPFSGVSQEEGMAQGRE